LQKQVKAKLVCKEACVLSGEPFVSEMFAQLDCTIHWLFHDGDRIMMKNNEFDKTQFTGRERGRQQVIATIEGAADAVLRGERTALNLLSRLIDSNSLCNCRIGLLASRRSPHDVWRKREARRESPVLERPHPDSVSSRSTLWSSEEVR
jgi:nicotinate-nucleotide pyrophosphorylase